MASAVASPVSSNASLYTLHTAQVTVSYTPDVFGATRRQVEGAQASTELQQFQSVAAKLTLSSNVVTAAITEASLRAQQAATLTIIAGQKEVLQAYRRQLALGQAARRQGGRQHERLAARDQRDQLDEVQGGLGAVRLSPGAAEANGGPRLADPAAGRAVVPAVPDRLAPRAADRAEHVPAQDPGPDVPESLRDEVIVHSGLPALGAEHRAKCFRREGPVVQGHAAGAHWAAAHSRRATVIGLLHWALAHARIRHRHVTARAATR